MQVATEAEAAAAAAAAAARGRSAVVLSGATGPDAPNINGVYEPTGEEHNSKPLYRKVGDPGWWLRCTPDGDWTVSSKVDMEANNLVGECSSAVIGLAHPTLATDWHFVQESKWVAEAGMTATVSA